MSLAVSERSPGRPDEVCAAAVDVARAAAVEDAGPDAVGEHLAAVADGERVVTHLFACLLPGYRGWRWAVTTARASRGKDVTVDEVALVAGDDSMLSPPWLPWSERLRPGDLGVGDLLPTSPDDERLVPAAFGGPDPHPVDVDVDEERDAAQVVFGLGLGRARVLSVAGRSSAATRWHSGDSGPRAPIARAAPAGCGTCGFFAPLRGALGAAFGVCANEYAPDDGAVVSADHGCGAHSEAVVVPASASGGAPVLDELGYDEAGPVLEHPPGSVSDSDTGEPFGHS